MSKGSPDWLAVTAIVNYTVDIMFLDVDCQRVCYDMDRWLDKILSQSYKSIAFFCDNSGADIVLGVMPLVIEFLSCGSKVRYGEALTIIQLLLECFCR